MKHIHDTQVRVHNVATRLLLLLYLSRSQVRMRVFVIRVILVTRLTSSFFTFCLFCVFFFSSFFLVVVVSLWISIADHAQIVITFWLTDWAPYVGRMVGVVCGFVCCRGVDTTDTRRRRRRDMCYENVCSALFVRMQRGRTGLLDATTRWVIRGGGCWLARDVYKHIFGGGEKCVGVSVAGMARANSTGMSRSHEQAGRVNVLNGMEKPPLLFSAHWGGITQPREDMGVRHSRVARTQHTTQRRYKDEALCAAIGCAKNLLVYFLWVQTNPF